MMLSSGGKSAQIRFEDHQDFLYAFISGEHDSLDLSLECWRRIIDECHNRDYMKLLIEESFPNQLSVTEVFALTTAIAKMPIARLKIAFVDQQSGQEELNLFGETVAVNRGVYGRVFKDLEAARDWLRSS